MTITTAYQAAAAPVSGRRPRPERMVCDGCGASVPMPAQCQFAPRWDEGWRWRGAPTKPLKFVPDTFLYSCPDCPPVI